ncbi:hypothetical protein OSB04_002923 [Centaurea solstitialis]|uniref:SWIM-type domain-containing protein n=1 Tax=Centaurea solstitialis TaxID=347529 RepID=A0AA38WMR7_9ASTR|nr:hypothetical protein OSB04_002923 [Centaurea solstitialis]
MVKDLEDIVFKVNLNEPKSPDVIVQSPYVDYADSVCSFKTAPSSLHADVSSTKSFTPTNQIRPSNLFYDHQIDGSGIPTDSCVVSGFSHLYLNLKRFGLLYGIDDVCLILFVISNPRGEIVGCKIGLYPRSQDCAQSEDKGKVKVVFKVKNLNLEQNNKKTLGNLFKNKFINVKRALTPKDMVQDVQEMYGFEISYATAWRARWKALELIRGSHAESFTRLPTYLYNLKRVNEGTRTAIRTDSSGPFAECFVALGVSIQTFLENLWPVLIIDAAHLKGAYLGTMFLVVAMDGNNNIVPVAFGVGRSETTDEWTWFLNMLKGCIGEPRGLVFMSDRDASINAAISAIFPGAHHALCCRHLVMNVRSRDPRIKVYRIAYWKACKAYTTRVFDRMMNILRVGVPEGAKLMEEVGVDRWSRAYFPAQRFNIMTSNSAESINAMSRFARRLPIVGLIEYFREFQEEWYFLRRNKAAELNHPLTEWAQLKIQKMIGKSAMWTVRGIGYGRWQVHDMDRGAEVDMTIRSCSCLKWQVSGLPCGHAIAVAKKLGEKDCFHLITVPYFMSELHKATYKGVINPVGPSQTWEYPEF